MAFAGVAELAAELGGAHVVVEIRKYSEEGLLADGVGEMELEGMAGQKAIGNAFRQVAQERGWVFAG
jgi:hypothetical protein